MNITNNVKNDDLITSQNRVFYFDFLRIAAMIAVVFIHVSSQGYYSVSINSFAWNIFNVYDSLSRWAVPIFLMISGALFLPPQKKEISLKQYYSKYIFRILCAYIVWSVFYALPLLLNGYGVKTFLAEIIKGHYHMWYLLMLVGLYIIIPLLRKITSDIKATKYYLFISFIFSFAIPAFLLAIEFFDNITGISIYNSIFAFFNEIDFHFAIGYSFYFVLGYYLSSIQISKRKETILYILGIVGFISTVLLTKGICLFFNEYKETFYENITINVLLESIAIFVFAKKRIAKLIKKEKGRNIIFQIAKLSFGVYLVHPFILELFEKIGLNTLLFNPILSVPGIAILVIILSLAISYVLNKIPIIKDYVV